MFVYVLQTTFIISSFKTMVREQSSTGPSGSNSTHLQPGTSEDSETTMTTTVMQDSSNEGTLPNSSSSSSSTVLQQLPEQQQPEETSHPSCSTADVA
jgi:hypothetical protein